MNAYLSVCAWRELDAITAMRIFRTAGLKEPRFIWGVQPEDALISRSRCNQGTKFLETKQWGEVFLSVDSDIEFKPEDAALIVKDVADGLDICGGFYVTRSQDAPAHPAVRLAPNQHLIIGRGEPAEIVYASTGFMAVHRKVFERLAETMELCRSGPRYFYPFYSPFVYKGEYLSEDWAFCQRARDIGFKIWLDPRIRLGHLGYKSFTVEEIHKNALNANRMAITEGRYDQTDIIPDLAAYWNLPYLETVIKLKNTDGAKLMADEWNTQAPSTVEEVAEFYKEVPDYITDLAQFNLRGDYIRRVDPTSSLSGRIADFGGGIGTLCLLLQRAGREVIYVDLPSPQRDFAEFRFRRHGANIKVADNLNALSELDAITAIDTIEHIHPEEIDKLAQQMYDVLVEGGCVITVSDFNRNDGRHPMHFPENKSKFERSMKAAGFTGGPIKWIKQRREKWQNLTLGSE